MSGKYVKGDPVKFVDVAFDSATEKTEIVDLEGGTIVGLRSLDANLVATAITFETNDREDAASSDFVTEREDDGTAYTVTIATQQKVAIQPAKTAGFSNFVRLASNGDETAAPVVRIYIKAVA